MTIMSIRSAAMLRTELEVAIDVAGQAGELVLDLRDNCTRRQKSDGSIVTSADLASADLIRNRLSAAFPGDAIFTEEDEVNGTRLSRTRCWIVDPIDGTSAFVSGSDDFDVYLALVEDGIPIVAVAYQPVTRRFIFASRGGGAWIEMDATRSAVRLPSPQSPPVIVTRHWLGAPGNLDIVRRLAERAGGLGRASSTGISPRTFLSAGVDAIVGISASVRPIIAKEWDIAPLDLIVREAGGWSSDLSGRSLQFNKPDPFFPSGILLARTGELGLQLVRAHQSGSAEVG